MPGHIIHLAAASRVLEHRPMEDDSANMFLLGAIVPDMFERSNKKQSHFWSEAIFKKFDRVPDVDAFIAKYGKYLSHPFVLGYYSHLYMDALFMKTSWKTHFSFYGRDKQPNDLFEEVAYIGYRRDVEAEEILYPREEFLSNAYYYGDYDSVNPYVINEYKVKIPKLPQTEIAVIEEVVVHEKDARLVKMLEVANDFRKCAASEVTAESTEDKLKVFRLSEFQYLIEETSNKILKSI